MNLSMRKILTWQNVAVVVWAVFISYLAVRIITFGGERSTYPLFLQGGINWREGLSIYYDACQNFQYYPGFAVLMSLFTFLPSPEIFGALLWSAINVGAFLLAARVFARTFIATENLRAIFFLALLPLALDGLLCQQSNPLIAATLMYGTVLIAQKKFTTAMIFLVFGGIIKIAPLSVSLLLVIVFFRQLGWRFPRILMYFLLLPLLLNDAPYVINCYREWWEVLLHEENGMRWFYRDFWTLWEYFSTGAVVTVAMTESAKEYLKYYRVLQLAVAGFLAIYCAYYRYFARITWSANNAAVVAFTAGVWWLMLFGPSTELATIAIPAPAIAWGLLNAYENQRGFILMLIAFVLILLGSNGDLDFYFRHTFPTTDLPKLLLPLGGVIFGAWIIIFARPRAQLTQ